STFPIPKPARGISEPPPHSSVPAPAMSSHNAHSKQRLRPRPPMLPAESRRLTPPTGNSTPPSAAGFPGQLRTAGRAADSRRTLLCGQTLQSFVIFGRCVGNDFFRQARARCRLVPVQCFQIITHILLVEAGRAHALVVLVGRPEA